MSDIHYSRLKLGLGLILCSLFFWGGVWMVGVFDAKGVFIGAVLAIFGALLMVKFARYLLDNRILSVSATGIEFHGIVSTRRLRFDQIAGMSVETTTTNYITQRALIITPAQGHGGKLRIAEMLLEGKVGGLNGLADLIANGAPQPSPEPFPLPRRAPTPPTGTPAGWHERGAAAAAPERARAGGFGRKGL